MHSWIIHCREAIIFAPLLSVCTDKNVDLILQDLLKAIMQLQFVFNDIFFEVIILKMYEMTNYIFKLDIR